jgi:hypothetical protein
VLDYDAEAFDLAAKAKIPISIGWFEPDHVGLAVEKAASPVGEVIRDFGDCERTTKDFARLQGNREKAMEPVATQIGGNGFDRYLHFWRRPNANRPLSSQANPSAAFHGCNRTAAKILRCLIPDLGLCSRGRHKEVLARQHVYCQLRYNCNLALRRCDTNDLVRNLEIVPQ